MAYVLYGLVNIDYYDKSTNQRVLSARTYTNGGIEVASNEIDIRGGLGNQLISKVFTDGNFTVNATDALFDFNYIKFVTGAIPSVGGTMIIEPETVTVTVANQITVTGNPVEWNGELCGWYSRVGEGISATWNKITFIGKTANVPGLAIGDKVCVQYNTQDNTIRTITVPSTIIPQELYLVMRAGLFNAGQTKGTFTPSSKAGDLIIEVPRFIFNPNTTFSFDNGGAATTDLSGSALVSYDTTTCDQKGTYAYIKEFITGRTVTDGLIGLAIDGGNELDVTTTTTITPSVIGVYSGGITGVMNPSDLTYTSKDTATFTVSNAGVVTGVAAGTAILEIIATGTSIETFGNVTVT